MNAAEPAEPTQTRPHPAGPRHHRGLAAAAALAATTAVLAACGSSSTASTGSVAGATSPVVRVGMATVNGSSEQVLTAAGGDTLYYLTRDSATDVTCTGSCAGVWPPLLLASGQPTAVSALPHSLTAYSGGNGRQVEYDGHPLYTYSGDSGPDQSNGEGLDGVWFVATPAMTAGSAATATPAATYTAPNGY